MVSGSRGWITKYSTHWYAATWKPDFWLTSHWATRDHRPVTSRASQLGRTDPSVFGQAKYSLLRQACQHQINLFSSLFFLDLPRLPWLDLGKYTLHKCLRSSPDMTQVFTWYDSGVHLTWLRCSPDVTQVLTGRVCLYCELCHSWADQWTLHWWR